MTKNNRVRNLHHSGFHMKGEQHSLIFRYSFLLSKETDKRRLAHAGRVDDFPGLQGNPFFKNSHCSISGGMLNLDRSRTFDCDRFFVRSEITFGHGRDTSFRISAPSSHRVRVGFGILLNSFWCATIRIALTKNWIHSTPLHLIVTAFDFLLVNIGRIFGVIRQSDSFRL